MAHLIWDIGTADLGNYQQCGSGLWKFGLMTSLLKKIIMKMAQMSQYKQLCRHELFSNPSLPELIKYRHRINGQPNQVQRAGHHKHCNQNLSHDKLCHHKLSPNLLGVTFGGSLVWWWLYWNTLQHE